MRLGALENYNQVQHVLNQELAVPLTAAMLAEQHENPYSIRGIFRHLATSGALPIYVLSIGTLEEEDLLFLFGHVENLSIDGNWTHADAFAWIQYESLRAEAIDAHADRLTAAATGDYPRIHVAILREIGKNPVAMTAEGLFVLVDTFPEWPDALKQIDRLAKQYVDWEHWYKRARARYYIHHHAKRIAPESPVDLHTAGIFPLENLPHTNEARRLLEETRTRIEHMANGLAEGPFGLSRNARRLIQHVQTGRLHLREYWTAAGGHEASVQAYTISRIHYENDDNPLVIMLRLRPPNVDTYHNTLLNEHSLFFIAVHELGHYMDANPEPRENSHDETFRDAVDQLLHAADYAHILELPLDDAQINRVAGASYTPDMITLDAWWYAPLLTVHLGRRELLTHAETARILKDDYSDPRARIALVKALTRIAPVYY